MRGNESFYQLVSHLRTAEELQRIDAIVQRIEGELGTKAKVVATGGLADLVAAETTTIEVVEPYLTLEGLRLIFERTMSDRRRVS